MNSLAIFNLKYEKIKLVITEYKIGFLSDVKIYANVINVYLQIILLCFWGMTTGSLYCCDGQSILKIQEPRQMTKTSTDIHNSITANCLAQLTNDLIGEKTKDLLLVAFI